MSWFSFCNKSRNKVNPVVANTKMYVVESKRQIKAVNISKASANPNFKFQSSFQKMYKVIVPIKPTAPKKGFNPNPIKLGAKYMKGAFLCCKSW